MYRRRKEWNGTGDGGCAVDSGESRQVSGDETSGRGGGHKG